ncbi:hypothetical protein D3C86_1651110 [compost metagenome]
MALVVPILLLAATAVQNAGISSESLFRYMFRNAATTSASFTMASNRVLRLTPSEVSSSVAIFTRARSIFSNSVLVEVSPLITH